MSDFSIYSGILSHYFGHDIHPVVPEGVTSIKGCVGSPFAYSKPEITGITLPDSLVSLDWEAMADCSKLTKIQLPEGLEEIGQYAFSGCSSLRKMVIPSRITELGESAFRCCRKLHTVILPVGMEYIGDHCFQNCSSMTSIELPENICYVGSHAFSGCKKLENFSCSKNLKLTSKMFAKDMPPFLLHRFAYFYPQMSDELVRDILYLPEFWSETDVSLQADLFLKKQNKTIVSAYAVCLKDPNPLGIELCSRLTPASGAKVCKAAAKFLELFWDRIPGETCKGLYNGIKAAKKSGSALLTLNNNTLLLEKAGAISSGQGSPAEKKISELLQTHGRTQYSVILDFKEVFGDFPLPGLHYHDQTKASPLVLQWLFLSPYEVRKRWNGSYEIHPRQTAPGVPAEAAEILEFLDRDSFQDALRELAMQFTENHSSKLKPLLLYPIVLYAEEALMDELCHLKACQTFPRYAFSDACPYSTTHAALLYCYEHSLTQYAAVRGTTVEALKEQYFSNVGLNEAGEKDYDLGNQTVTAVLQPDLSFLIRTAAGKIMKSMPKKGVDPQKYAHANTDYKEIQKNAKRLLKNRCNILWEAFLSGKTMQSSEWEETYVKNILFRSVTKLLVWKQEQKTFSLDAAGPVLSDGIPYKINSYPVKLAHPMEMEPVEVEAWQKYFISRGLKQPFLQIWEPVIDPSEIRGDRYAGCMIPYYRFRSMDKHGIHIEDENFHNDITIRFDGCCTEVKRHDWMRHMINNDDRFEVVRFRFPKYTRQVNHIVAYLDRITVYDRILKDDVTIEALLPGFTLAQITDFINLATENSCPNVTALLLNYKNEHFSDFDPMEEFILGEL